jgi:hypothetical protein
LPIYFYSTPQEKPRGVVLKIEETNLNQVICHAKNKKTKI